MILWVASRVRLAIQRPVAPGQRDSTNFIRPMRLQVMTDTIAGGPASTPTCRIRRIE
jgi:hypothetical protein